MTIDLTEEQTNALLDLIEQMYDDDGLIEQAADLLCGLDEEVRAITSMSKKDVLMFLLQELADTKHAYMRDI